MKLRALIQHDYKNYSHLTDINAHQIYLYKPILYYILIFIFWQVPDEVTYAELSLVRPNTLDATKNGGNQYGTLRARDEPTIYAQIDHSKKPPNGNAMPPAVTAAAVKSSPVVSPVSSLFPMSKPGLYHREVVTVRTPLMGCQQESCV